MTSQPTINEPETVAYELNAPPLLSLPFSERKLLLFLVDLTVINAALAVSLWARGTYEVTPLFLWTRLHWFVLLSGLWLAIGSLLELYDLARAASPLHALWSASGAAFLTGVLYLAIPFITPELPGRRSVVFAFLLLLMAGVAAWRFFYASVVVQPAFHQRALVVGGGWAGRTLAQAMAEMGHGPGNPLRGTGYRILGFVDDDPAKQGQLIEGIPVRGRGRDLLTLVHHYRPDEIIVAITHADLIRAPLFQAILECRARGIRVTTMTSLYERLTGRVPVEHAGQELQVVLPVELPAWHGLYLTARRLIDVAVGLLAGLLVLLVAPFIWLANRLTSPGDLFYRQERVGQGGRLFEVVKFRSMIMNAEQGQGAQWARQNDRRITPAGRFLRRTRLDELPQCWNVLKGEMSVIGPRPERPEFVCQLARAIPFYQVRQAVRPGITGWAQVKYHYGASVEDALVKLQYDLYYIKHQVPYLDLLILLKTMQVMLGLRGR